MIKKGLLDKHGKPNEKTPSDYFLSKAAPPTSMDTTDSKDFVIPSEGPEPVKRKVCILHI